MMTGPRAVRYRRLAVAESDPEKGALKRVAIYVRVSTAKQDTESAQGARGGGGEIRLELVRIYEDAGISGAKGRNKHLASIQ
jgi:Resolvase, N terminal domain